MAITPPNFQKDAVPTVKGWVHPKTGELLKSQRITQAQIDEWHGKPLDELIEPEKVAQEEALDSLSELDQELESMTKVQLEELAREKGVELDRRKKKKDLVATVRNLFSK